MRSFACLWFELQMTQRYLPEETFAPATVPPNAANLDAPFDIGALHRASIEQVPGIESGKEPPGSCSRKANQTKSQTKTAYMTKQQSNAVDAKSDEIAQLVRNFIE
jgi:hypothetical protein